MVVITREFKKCLILTLNLLGIIVSAIEIVAKIFKYSVLRERW